jgi:3-oxoacyl-[acyl-carrier protein] reductase
MNVLVLGGSKGLGKATAEKFISEGYNVFIASRSKPSFIEESNYISVDLKSIDSVQKALEQVENLNIDILINNSGGPTSKPFEEVDEVEFLQEIQGHLISFHLFSKKVVKEMKNKKFGRIINIVSVTANNPLPNMIVSNTLRGAIINWSKTLSKELGPFNITVNNVLPGYTETERLYEVVNSVADKNNSTADVIMNKLISEIPMNRFGKPSEFAECVYFLSSKSASYINGQSVSVDGGWTPCI